MNSTETLAKQSAFMKVVRYLSLFTNKRMLTVFFLGFSSGLPLALSGSTLQAWFTVSGVSVVSIGVLTLVGQPYVCKFLWAPFLDRFVPPFLGRRRGWIAFMQCCVAVVLIAMSFENPSVSPWSLGFLALALSFCSATQDISIDAYRTDLLKPLERGMGSAMNVGGYRIAMLVSGGLAMVMAGEFGWRSTYMIMAVLMLAGVIATIRSPELDEEAHAPMSMASAIINPFKEFLMRRAAWVILLFIILYKLGDAFTLALGTTFLLRGVHFSLVDVGAIYKVVGLLGALIGIFLGGALMPALGMYRSLLYFGILQALSNLMFMALAIVGKSYSLMVTAIALETLCAGLATAAFVAFLMALCDKRYTATQFALLSAFSAIGRVFVGPVSGVMVVHIGWAQFYFWAFLFALPGLWLLMRLKNNLDFEYASPLQV